MRHAAREQRALGRLAIACGRCWRRHRPLGCHHFSGLPIKVADRRSAAAAAGTLRSCSTSPSRGAPPGAAPGVQEAVSAVDAGLRRARRGSDTRGQRAHICARSLLAAGARRRRLAPPAHRIKRSQHPTPHRARACLAPRPFSESLLPAAAAGCRWEPAGSSKVKTRRAVGCQVSATCSQDLCTYLLLPSRPLVFARPRYNSLRMRGAAARCERGGIQGTAGVFGEGVQVT